MATLVNIDTPCRNREDAKLLINGFARAMISAGARHMRNGLEAADERLGGKILDAENASIRAHNKLQNALWEHFKKKATITSDEPLSSQGDVFSFFVWGVYKYKGYFEKDIAAHKEKLMSILGRTFPPQEAKRLCKELITFASCDSLHQESTSCDALDDCLKAWDKAFEDYKKILFKSIASITPPNNFGCDAYDRLIDALHWVLEDIHRKGLDPLYCSERQFSTAMPRTHWYIKNAETLLNNSHRPQPKEIHSDDMDRHAKPNESGESVHSVDRAQFEDWLTNGVPKIKLSELCALAQNEYKPGLCFGMLMQIMHIDGLTCFGDLSSEFFWMRRSSACTPARVR